MSHKKYFLLLNLLAFSCINGMESEIRQRAVNNKTASANQENVQPRMLFRKKKKSKSTPHRLLLLGCAAACAFGAGHSFQDTPAYVSTQNGIAQVTMPHAAYSPEYYQDWQKTTLFDCRNGNVQKYNDCLFDDYPNDVCQRSYCQRSFNRTECEQRVDGEYKDLCKQCNKLKCPIIKLTKPEDNNAHLVGLRNTAAFCVGAVYSLLEALAG